MMKKKIKFPKRTKLVNAESDLHLPYPDVSFEVWIDPSRAVIEHILAVSFLSGADELEALSEERQQQIHDNFFMAIAELIVDSNVGDLDFTSAEAVVESMSHPSVPIGFVYEAITMIVAWLLEENKKLGKVFGVSSAKSSSGNSKKPKASKSKSES